MRGDGWKTGNGDSFRGGSDRGLKYKTHCFPTKKSRHAAAEFFFIPTAERRQEADHALLKAGGKSWASGAYLSLVLRVPELEEICSTPDGWETCSKARSLLQDPSVLATRLGVHRHPLFVRATQEKQSKRKKLQVLQCVLYALDADAQFMRLQDAQKRRKRRAQVLKEKASGKPIKRKWSKERISDVALLQHVQAIFKPGKLYSIPAAALQCNHMDERRQDGQLDPTSAALEADAPANDWSDEAATNLNDELGLGPARDNVFFRVLSTRPSLGKYVPLPTAAGRFLRRDDVSITLHRATQHGDVVCVDTSPLQQHVAKALPALSVANLLAGGVAAVQGLAEWSRLRTPHYSLQGEDTEAYQHLLQKLCSLSAFPGSDQALHEQDGSADAIMLDALADKGIVDRLPAYIGTSRWQFTEDGVRRLSLAQRLAQPRLVCAPRTGVPLKDQTPWELLNSLQGAGWHIAKASKKHRMLPYVQGGDKVCYLAYTDLGRANIYAQSLLLADDLFEAGSLTELHHCQPKAYYLRVITGCRWAK